MALTEKMPKVVDMTQEEMDGLLERLEGCSLDPQDKVLLKGVVHSVLWLREKVEAGKVTIHKLKRLFRGFRSEKHSAKRAPEKEANKGEGRHEGEEDIPEDPHEIPDSCETFSTDSSSKKPPVKGHGRMGADSYTCAEEVEVLHHNLQAGGLCPAGCGGRVYDLSPGMFLQIQGQSFVKAVKYSLQKLRCALCGHVFTASLPLDLRRDCGKYNFRFKALLVCQKYFVGVPLYRQETFQDMLNVALPDATQWDLIREVSDVLEPLLPALEKGAANGEVLYSDDTGVRILDVMKEVRSDPNIKRKGTFTSAFYGEMGSFFVALYYSSRLHAGENLVRILRERNPELPRIIHMSDALAANSQEEVKDILEKAFCLAHARRRFEELIFLYPKESRTFMTQVGKAYKNDKEAKDKGLSPQERLRYHQEHSGPVMERLHLWLKNQSLIAEPNGILKKAILYSLTHWDGLTLFLRRAGAPLDNNVCEQLIKLPIRLRKNALFHRTERGAQIAGLMMSVIETCRLNQVNPVDYLTACQLYSSDVARDPQAWLPWAYQETLEAKAALSHPLMAA